MSLAPVPTAAQGPDVDGMLRLRGIGKAYGAVAAVDDLSLSVKRGEFVSLLGPSGCGKTTTLRMVAGFIDPDAGEIILDGERIDTVPSHRRGTAMVFQNYALFPHMTVFDNIAFGPRMHKAPRADVARRVEAALALVQLPGLGARYPKELSGGQQQRVALARAVVLNPKLLLLDEPLSNLDAKLRKEVRTEFLDVHRRSGITTLFVTHDLEEAFAVSDRVAVMNAGRIEQYGTPHAIFTRPRSRFVADFVGHGNHVEGCVALDARGGAMLQTADGFAIAVPAVHAAAQALFVLPNHKLRLRAAGASPHPPGLNAVENWFPAQLETLSYVGSTVHYRVRLHGRAFCGEAYATTELLALAPGAAVEAGWHPADLIEVSGDTS